MHSHQRARWKILFEALCALGLAASFAAAWDQTGSSALLASAAIIALVAIYWSFGLVRRERPESAVQSIAVVAEPQEAAVETVVREEVLAQEPEAESAVRVEVFPFEPDLSEPGPATPAPKKKRARKAKKATVDAAPVVERLEPAEIGDPLPHELPIEQLFEPQPFVRQPRPAFGRKARGPRSLQAG